MNDKAFGKRLAKESARWQQEGWLSAEGRQAILADVATRQSRLSWPGGLAQMGALLLGIGVLSWFAANWDAISKPGKLLLIFLALGSSHAAYGFSMTRELQKLAQGMAVLSVLLFGAAIMLIGQLYHIDAHFPDGIALWAAGGLLTAALLQSQPAMLISLGLAALWTGYEQFEYAQMNWLLPGYLLLAALVVQRQGWALAARGCAALLLLWLTGWHAQSWPLLDDAPQAHLRLFALQLLALAGLWAMTQTSRQPCMRTGGGTLLAGVLSGTFALTFPDFVSAYNEQPVLAPLWLAGLLASGSLYTMGLLLLARRQVLSPLRRYTGLLLVASFAVLVACTVLFSYSGSWPALLWNAVFLGMMGWMADVGIRGGDRAIINQVFGALLCWLLARYVDAFWTLLDRSLFFMAGGVLLLAAGGWMERRRRSLLARIPTEEQP